MSRILKRRVGSLKYNAGTTSTLPLPRNYHQRRIILNVTARHNNGANASFFYDRLSRIIRTLSIVGNGTKTIKQIAGFKLTINEYQSSGGRSLDSVVTAPNKNNALSSAHYIVDFEMPNMARPHDTIENSALFDTYDLQIDWANTDCLGDDITIISASVEVSVDELINYKRNPGELVRHNVETQMVENITATTSEFMINLPTQRLYRKITIVGIDAGERNGSVIRHVRLKSGNTTFCDIRSADIRAQNIRDYGITVWQTQSFAIHTIDFCPRGRLSDALDTRGKNGFNSLELLLDVKKVSETTQIYVFMDFIETENFVEVPAGA